MNYYTYLETSRFEVKNPEQFKKDLGTYVEAEEIELVPHSDGFILYACNANHIQFSDDPNIPDSIAHFIQVNMRPDQLVHITRLHYSSRNTELAATFSLVGEYGVTTKTSEDVFSDMAKDHFPRMMTCIDNFHCKTTDVWLVEGNRYKVLGKLSNDFYIVESSDGHKVNCTKSRFK